MEKANVIEKGKKLLETLRKYDSLDDESLKEELKGIITREEFYLLIRVCPKELYKALMDQLHRIIDNDYWKRRKYIP